ncbi:protein HEXIM1 [Tribolium madens]|uniref:protein HEXIM1 n=1 Tax=Tribolium madens TaxID=41895 RepID=UPI001CF76270|nr:protein HEXIM1 [Tribolium madens]
MSEKCEKNGPENPDGKTPATLPQGDVVQQKDACAPARNEPKPKSPECDIPTKKRKTRRGKSKRRYPYPKNGRKSTKVMKPEAPYNSNQFLLEDHGNIEELDENLKNADQNSTTSRTRDSSFSVDSEGEFYSSPDDEEQFLIKDFVDQYESVQAERLQSMSKDKLIQEYLMLESKLELLTKRQRKREATTNSSADLQSEVERLTIENEALRRENAALRSKTCSSNSEDSETDSNDSCSSTSSSSSSCCSAEAPPSPVLDYSQTNGHSASVETV